MRELLVVVDMQTDFVDGALGTKEAQNIVENVVSKVKSAKECGKDIIFTMDTHQENYSEASEIDTGLYDFGKTFFWKHTAGTYCRQRAV